MDYNAQASEMIGLQEDGLYKRSYGASIAILKNVIPFLAKDDDTALRLKNTVRSVPRLIAAGLHNSVPSSKSIEILSEAALCCRESVVMLSYCRDLHGQFINGNLCNCLIETYRSVGDELGLFAAANLKEGGGC